ncbi:hypothetical protein [Hamadaea tsunoensis]|uniref:hypothetical protein n=1 Tax=Hamadaea tsunoensis TaxID=53368 RepID=UPI0004063232|nr:hypothetical protein [Hamadaea tsunoensis]
MMRLPTLRATEASGDSWDDPEPDKLASLVRDLDEANRFLILERHDGPSLWQFYMQIYRNDDGSYAVEYRAGGPDSHFRAGVPTAERAAQVLTAWAADEPGWRDLLPWQAWADQP